MNSLYMIISLLFLAIAGYYAVCHIIRLWTGCSSSEAGVKLRNFMNGKRGYKFEEDAGFQYEIWEAVRNIIGDKRYVQLERLSYTITDPESGLLFFGETGGLPFIAVSMYYLDSNEKQVLENVIKNLVRRYLKAQGYGLLMLAEWKVRNDLHMPYLQIRYARTDDEKRLVGMGLQDMRDNIVSLYSPLYDDTEDEDLNG